MNTWIRALVITGILIAGTAEGATGKSVAGRLAFKAGDTWKMQETTVMAAMEMGGMSQPAAASVSQMTYTVEKVFPDKSALVSFATTSCQRGTTLADLKEAPLPNGGKPGYALWTKDGRKFMVQGKMTVEDPNEQAMMDASGTNTDEVELLKSSKTTAKFLKVMRNQGPIDAVHFPAKTLKKGAKAKMDGYAVTRLPDEAIDGVKCEVYKAVMEPMVETCWLDAKAGRIVKRTVVQGNPAVMETSQTIVK
jgi:hypothetical protein